MGERERDRETERRRGRDTGSGRDRDGDRDREAETKSRTSRCFSATSSDHSRGACLTSPVQSRHTEHTANVSESHR